MCYNGAEVKLIFMEYIVAARSDYNAVNREHLLAANVLCHPAMISGDAFETLGISVCPTRLIKMLEDVETFSIAVSRKSRRTSTGATWVREICHTMEMLDPRRAVFIGSIGSLQHDFASYRWLKIGGQCLIVCTDNHTWDDSDDPSPYRFLHRQSGIIRLVPWNPTRRPPDRKSVQPMRDRLVFAMSDCVYPVSMRKSGNMADLLCEYREMGGAVKSIDIRRKGRNGDKAETLMPEIFRTRDLTRTHESIEDIAQKYLWHFTRGRAAPWPGDGWEIYLDGLAGEGQRVPYSTVDALERILCSRKIMASRYLIRGGYPVVCLSDAPFSHIREMNQWQVHLRRTRFELSGIGIRRETAIQMGAKPVIYGSESRFNELDERDRFRFQKDAVKSGDWRKEQEWRIRGDIDLRGASKNELVVIVRDESEYSRIRTNTSLPIYVFLSE